MQYFDYLIYLAKKGALYSVTSISTLGASSDLKKSQQSLSRIFREMEAQGLISRQPSHQGLEVALTEKGRDVLNKHYKDLRKLFEEKKELAGIVRSGIGEGSWYVARYKSRIKKALGLVPYKGTLNLEVNVEEKQRFLAQLPQILIQGFTLQGRTFGSIRLSKIKINGVLGAVVVPERARHPEEIVEVIAPLYLRERFRLKDGDKIAVRVC